MVTISGITVLTFALANTIACLLPKLSVTYCSEQDSRVSFKSLRSNIVVYLVESDGSELV